MTDRELLELAAKAAGYREWEYCERGHEPSLYVDGHGFWAPLHDDGDALRLAVNLRIRIAGMGQRACAFTGLQEFWEKEESDLYAATRRAIVRAAAEIGRAMP